MSVVIKFITGEQREFNDTATEQFHADDHDGTLTVKKFSGPEFVGVEKQYDMQLVSAYAEPTNGED